VIKIRTVQFSVHSGYFVEEFQAKICILRMMRHPESLSLDNGWQSKPEVIGFTVEFPGATDTGK
jgi:hypothetical protein